MVGIGREPENVEVPITPGSNCWARCPAEGYARARVDHVRGEVATVKFVDGGSVTCPVSQLRHDDGDFGHTECNTSLPRLDEAHILENLRKRFHAGHPYTYTANVLFAVNPYRELDLYHQEVQARYREHNRTALPPHPYAIAMQAYRDALVDGRDQTVVVSGESGAGKTRSVHYLLDFLAGVSAAREHMSDAHLRILNAAPILESLGNAQTIRNANSSRFGKFNRLHFTNGGHLVGASIQAFLLEASRVVHHAEGELNYHVFYTMLAGLRKDEMGKLGLVKDNAYHLIDKHSCRREAGAAAKFKELRKALSTVGFDAESQDALWQFLAAIIHLGEVSFEGPEDAENSRRNSLDPARSDVRVVSPSA